MEIRDYDKQLRGHVIRREDRVPKAITEVDPSYCRLHFPRMSAPCTRLVLVEDILSAEVMAPYTPTAALLGTILTNDQVDYLLDKGIRDVVFCLDDDATDKALKQARKHNLYLNSTAVQCNPDPKDMSWVQLKELLERIEKV